MGIKGSADTGELVQVNLYARDATDAVTGDYRGTVHFTSSDPHATLPPDHAFSALNGGSFFPFVTFMTKGTQTVTATDTVNGSITGVSQKIAVTSPVATNLAVGTIPMETTVGDPLAVVVNARGSGGGTDVNYRGTIDFTSATDSHAVLPGTYTFTAADNGRHIFCPVPPWSTTNSPCVPSTPTTPAPDNVSFTGGATFATTGVHTVTATDRAHPISGTSDPVQVTSGTPTKFQVVGASDVPVGSLFAFTVSALNDKDRATRGYRGTVHLTSTDPAAVLPPDHTFTVADAGTYQNVVVTFKTVGVQTVTVTDTATTSIKGTSAPVTVKPVPVTTTTTTTTVPGSATTTTTPATTTTRPGTTTTTTSRPAAAATASGPSTAHRGEQITLTGSGFPTGQPLRLTMLSAATALGMTMSDSAGKFRVSVTIPNGAALGAHRIVVNTPDGVHEAFVEFTVTDASSSPSLASQLATTGASPLGLLGVAYILVTMGALAVGAASFRRRRVPPLDQFDPTRRV